MRSIVAAVLALLLAPGFALADETIHTAPATQSLPAASQVSPLDEAGAAAGDDSAGVRMGPCGPEKVTEDGKTETKAHGFVEAGVGTHGYRHIAAGVCKPLANGGAIAVSVSQSQVQGRR
ncbi:MAG TPA: hypothetical protein VN814_01915 [Caulobacteraceae bacterium]|nr:hypothetical protein [Caulobacteraceae bacterium]